MMCPASVREEMMSRVKTITERLHALKLENDEVGEYVQPENLVRRNYKFTVLEVMK